MALVSGVMPAQARSFSMSESEQSGSEASASVRLHVAHFGRVDIDSARDALTNVAWLGRPGNGPVDQPDVRRIAADLELPILDGSATIPVRKAALIDLGAPRVEDGGLTLTVAWQSATHAPMFPVFVGELRVARTGLVLDGLYVPPFGRIGLVIDATLLHFVARRTAQAFLTRIVVRLSS
jgi:hypothetical protein